MLYLPTLTVKQQYKRADEAYALSKKKVLSWQQKAITVSEWSCSDTGREFHVDGPTRAKHVA